MKHACVLALAAACAVTSAHAGDAESGRRLALDRCASCHTLDQRRRDEVADAPPFEMIARKFSSDSGTLVVALREPHRKMNFRPTQREAEDIAEYIHSLAR